MIFLAGRHGHLRASDGRVDDSTRALFSRFTNQGWSGIHLGPVTCTGSPRAISVACTEDLIALCELLDALRVAQPGVWLCVELLDEPWGEDVWCLLMARLDGVSLSGAALERVREHINTVPPSQLVLDLPITLSATPEQLVDKRAQLERIEQLIDRVHLYHDPEQAVHRVGGSERASAKLVRVASTLISGLSIDVLISGRIKHGEDARRVVEAIPGAWVGMHRGAWAVPDVIAHDARGELGAYCTGCMACEAIQGFERMGCALHFSRSFLERLRVESPDVLQIMGASYDAMTLAIEAANAGVPHVELWTLGELPGGMMRLRGRVPQQAESAETALTRLAQCEAHPGIMVDRQIYERDVLVAHLETSVSAVRVLAKMPKDAQGRLRFPAHPSASSRHHHSAIELLKQGSVPAQRVERELWVVHGDTLLAAECALFIRMQWREVCWVGEVLAGDTLPIWRQVYEERLRARGVEMMSRAEYSAHEDTYEEVHDVNALCAWSPDAYAMHVLARFPGMYRLDDVYEPVRRRRVIARFEL